MDLSPSQSKSRAFTLVETLIVVSVVALLAAIVIPAFSRVRNSARTATCASNLRQIGQAFQMYVSDNRGFYPIVPGNSCSWPEQIYPYARATAIFHCPAYKYGEFRPASGCKSELTTLTSLESVNHTGYDGHGSYNLNLFRPSPFNEIRLRAPSETILFCDGKGDYLPFGDLFGSGSTNGIPDDPRDFTYLGNRHNYGSNVAYADGHVKWKSFDALLEIKQWQAR